MEVRHGTVLDGSRGNLGEGAWREQNLPRASKQAKTPYEHAHITTAKQGGCVFNAIYQDTTIAVRSVGV